MSSSKHVIGSVAALLICLFALDPCIAQDSIVVPGSQRNTDRTYLSETPATSTRGVMFYAAPTTSYCCEVIPTNAAMVDEPAYFPADIRNLSNGSVVPSKSRGGDVPVISVWANHPAPYDTRRCFAVNGQAAQGYLNIPVVLGTPNGTYLEQKVECIETTLHGGYNTNVTDFNFLEITNVSMGGDPTINVYMTIFDLNGNYVVEARPYAIARGARTDVDIHSIVGRGKYGSIVLTHDGPPGALKAVVTQYRVASTSPLDFFPVAREVFTTR